MKKIFSPLSTTLTLMFVLSSCLFDIPEPSVGDDGTTKERKACFWTNSDEALSNKISVILYKKQDGQDKVDTLFLSSACIGYIPASNDERTKSIIANFGEVFYYVAMNEDGYKWGNKAKKNVLKFDFEKYYCKKILFSRENANKGKLFFWTTTCAGDAPEVKYISIEIDGKRDTLRNCFGNSAQPDCGDEHTFTVELAPGTYNCQMNTAKNMPWSGKIKVESDVCKSVRVRFGENGLEIY